MALARGCCSTRASTTGLDPLTRQSATCCSYRSDHDERLESGYERLQQRVAPRLRQYLTEHAQFNQDPIKVDSLVSSLNICGIF